MTAIDIPVLTTERLLLRPFTQDDLEELVPIQEEESFWWYPLRRGMTADETAAFLSRVIAHYEADGFGLEAVIDRSSDAMLGWAGLAVPHFLPRILPAVEVGWRLVPAVRGRGLATEAGAAAMRYGFTDAGLERIVSIYEPGNIASGRVMAHLGLRHYLTTPGPRGEELYVTALGRVDWEDSAARG
jgi:RimJ/RimL family protein N-acetyltransferase